MRRSQQQQVYRFNSKPLPGCMEPRQTPSTADLALADVVRTPCSDAAMNSGVKVTTNSSDLGRVNRSSSLQQLLHPDPSPPTYNFLTSSRHVTSTHIGRTGNSFIDESRDCKPANKMADTD